MTKGKPPELGARAAFCCVWMSVALQEVIEGDADGGEVDDGGRDDDG